MNAHAIVNRLLEGQPIVVWVYEKGTVDPFNALYINNALICTNPRRDVANVLNALGVKTSTVFIPKGFHGDFPAQLSQLETEL